MHTCIGPLVAEQLHTYVYMFYFSYAFACIMNNLHGWLHVVKYSMHVN